MILNKFLFSNTARRMLRQTARGSFAYSSTTSCVCDHPCDGGLSSKSEQRLNEQIGKELSASHSYLAMAAFCTQSSVALRGAAGFCLSQSDEERSHAAQLIAFQTMRGGKPVFGCLQPEIGEWCGLGDIIHSAYTLETKNLESLKSLHQLAVAEGDVVLADFIASKYILEQYEEIQELAIMRSRLLMSSAELILFDRELQERYPYNGDLHIQRLD